MLLLSRSSHMRGRQCSSCCKPSTLHVTRLDHRLAAGLVTTGRTRATAAAAAPAPAITGPLVARINQQSYRNRVIAAAQQNSIPDEYEEDDEFEATTDEGETDAATPVEAELDDEAEFEDEEFYDELAEAPLDAESLRIRQQMASEAGPSSSAAGAADEFEDEGEYDEAEVPFPEPDERPTLLSDLLGLAAEVQAAQLVQQDFPDVFITGITDVADLVLPGDLYCCTQRITTWGHTDGHDPNCIAAAVEAGAVAIMAERGSEGLIAAAGVPDEVPVVYCSDTDELSSRLAAVYFDTPAANLNTVAVTGTSGKTTVAWLVRGVLEQAGELTGMIGSIEHALAEQLLTPEGQLWQADDEDPAAGRECSSPFCLVPYKGRYMVEETTPNPLQMQRLLAAMRDRGATAAVVECTAKGIGSASTEWLSPNIAVFTNLGDSPDDLELFESKEEYLGVQLQLFRALQDADTQRAVVNLDDEAARAVLEASKAVPSLTYSMSNTSASVYCESLELTLWQTTMIVATPVGRLEIITNLAGRHNVYNVLAAVAVGVLLNVPLADIGAGIEAVQVVPGRCEVVNNIIEFGDEADGAEQLVTQLPHDFPVVVDAADTPQRLATVLESLREAGAKRVFTVFGCDGVLTSGETRARMGEVAHQRSEFVILTNSSPSLEHPADIIKDIVSGWPNELFEPYAAYVYNVFQDQTRAPLWFEPFLHSAQRRWQRHIMEDRFQAIRAAIGTAAPGDVVLLAGRGHKDWVDHADSEGGIVRGWFDDRVEARNALGRLEYLYALTGLDRSALPWGPSPEEGKTVVVEL